MLLFSGVRAYKGFELTNVLKLEKGLTVLTGINGSGKTRLLHAIKNGAISVAKDGEVISLGAIEMIEQDKLAPNFHYNYEEGARKEKIRSLKVVMEQKKDNLDHPLDSSDPSYSAGIGQSGITWGAGHRILGDIANKLQKKPSELSFGEVEAFYDEFDGFNYGVYAIGAIFNTYMKIRDDNLYNEWLSEAKGREDVYFCPGEKFESKFGCPPWITLNSILNETFGGKFKFVEPGAMYDPEFVTSLVLTNGNVPLVADDLSSGEKTLLWIVFKTFETRASKGDISKKHLLLLDEPDAFLHPSMIVKMIDCFAAINSSMGLVVIIATHSPTTVALAPSESIHIVAGGEVLSIDQDEAISNLLKGVTKISINPHNRRQIYVESSNDVDIYQMLYQGISRYADLLDDKISLNFISAGMKYPAKLVSEKLRQFFGNLPVAEVELYTKAINGVGGCSAVVGTVEYLLGGGSTTVRGLIDRDERNKSDGFIYVVGGGACYAIENLVFDPICTLLQAHLLDEARLSMKDVCGQDTSFKEWLKDDDLLQASVDIYILNLLGVENERNCLIEYVGGKRVLSDARYFNHNGHLLWRDKIIKKYPWLAKNGQTEDGVKKEIVRLSMLKVTDGEFIPLLLVESLLNLQK
ncbi:AAA family ATPase [Pseudomonas sp. NPDC088885]|uniref:AAA family ATPase n=1 Tax=Pseudomonas sp. NPDC088885 TaxID=3364457 RepID=UPI00380E08AF